MPAKTPFPFFLGLAFTLTLLTGVPFFASAATDCSSIPGTRPAIASDAAVENGQITVGTCYNPDALGIGQTAEQAKQYLLSIAKDLRGSQAPPDKAHIEPLNNSFAICAANFLKAYIQQYGQVNVVSAFRCGPNTPAAITASTNCNQGENGAAGGATNSTHQLGVALDINPAGGNSSYDTLHSFAQANPQFGVTFPWPFYQGATDKNHMQASNTSNPSCSGVTGTPVTAASATGAPLDQTIRNLLGQNQMNTSACVTSTNPTVIAPAGTVQQSQCISNSQIPAPPTPPAATTASTQTTATTATTPTTATTQSTTATTATPPSIGTLNTTAYAAGTCNPQNYCYSDGNIYYRNTQCVDQVYQACKFGCSGVICNASSTSSSLLNSSTLNANASGNSDTSSSGQGSGTSTFDLISEFANPIMTATDIGTATPISLNADTSNIENAAALQGTPPPSGGGYASGTIATVQPTNAQQTFTSNDLAGSPVTSYAPQSTLMNILSTMKNIVLGMFVYLQPFGGVVPSQQYAE